MFYHKYEFIIFANCLLRHQLKQFTIMQLVNQYQKMSETSNDLTAPSNPYSQHPPALDSSQTLNQHVYTQFNHNIPVDKDIRLSILDAGFGEPNHNSSAFAADRNELNVKAKSWHYRSLLATLILGVGEGVLLGCYNLGDYDWSFYTVVGFATGIYIVYLVMALICNPLFSYCSNLSQGHSFEEEYNKIRNLAGQFSFFAECYHYDIFIDRNQNDSNIQTRSKVITHTATEKVRPRAWRDDSGHAGGVNTDSTIIFVHNLVQYRFSDERSRRVYSQLWNEFRQRHRRDIYQVYSEKFEVPGLKDRVGFYIGESKPNLIGPLLIFSLVGLVWPFSMAIESKITRFNLNFMKVVTL